MKHRIVAWTLVWAVAALAGCSDRQPAPVNQSGSAHTYTVRGQILQLPSANSVDQRMMIHHEAIPDFKDEHGKVVGMKSMIMPFPVAAGVSLDGLEVGDPIRFSFDLDWESKQPYQITKIEKLPAGTKLNWGH
jgi:Cu/Ag efflux protein CusF